MTNTRCRSCGQPILWAETEKGKRMPVDPTPVIDGNIYLVVRERGLPPLALTASKVGPPTFNEERFKSHFATCVFAAKHRNKS